MIKIVVYQCMLGLITAHGIAQDIFKFMPTVDLPVVESNNLSLAWAGGLNSAQYGTIDLNLDGLSDLIIFDRTSNKINTFLSNGSDFVYSPKFEYLFPENLNSWVLLADYNCDGKKDLFTNTTFGLKVYLNTSEEHLDFELQQDPLMSESNSILVNLQVSASDLPAISDVDHDGDLDILVFNFSTGSSIEYHQNQSMETQGACGSLQFKKITEQWGEFQECDCGEYAFGKSCNELGGRRQHAGGKSLVLVDQDFDGDMDLIFGDEFCTNIAFLPNYGSASEALFTEARLDYPNSSTPIDYFIFPGLFLEDLNFDGRTDLISSPNVFESFRQMVDFQHSSYFYANDGLPGSESFTFQSNEFLQDRMIELGESVTPCFLDTDGDGDQDMLLGHIGNIEGASLSAGFHLYENTGDLQQATFQRINTDFLGVSAFQLNTLKPSFDDLDGDGNKDLLFSAADANGQTNIYYFLNGSNTGFEPATVAPQLLPFNIQAGDHPFFTDLDEDGRADLLLGRRTGRLEYWRTTSTGGTFSFDLVQESVAGIVDDSFKRELAPTAADINADGELELITSDATGTMRIYKNFLNPSESDPLEMFDLVIQLEEGTSLVKSRLGRGATVAAASLGPSLPHLVVGSKQGGVFLLENFSLSDGGGNGTNFSLQVYPVPAEEIVTIRGNQNFALAIYNSLGQLVLGGLEGPNQSLVRIASGRLHPGIYLVQASTASGATQVRKMVIR